MSLCVVPENINTSRREGIFPKDPPPHQPYGYSKLSFTFFGLRPHLTGISKPFYGEGAGGVDISLNSTKFIHVAIARSCLQH